MRGEGRRGEERGSIGSVQALIVSVTDSWFVAPGI
jgi:hypothetical protein